MLSIARSAASRAREKNLGPANAADSLKNRGRKGTRKLPHAGVKLWKREQMGTIGNDWEHLDVSASGAQVRHQAKGHPWPC